jgi:hypothetical protein
VLTSALLGSAQLTSIADINTNIFARKMNALPATNVLMGYLKQLNPLDAGHRRIAVYLAAGARDATRTLAGLSRWFGETHGPRWTQVLADDVLRVTGMNKFFEAGRNSFIEDYFAQIGRERGLAYDQLPEWRRAAFERHGITPRIGTSFARPSRRAFAASIMSTGTRSPRPTRGRRQAGRRGAARSPLGGARKRRREPVADAGPPGTLGASSRQHLPVQELPAGAGHGPGAAHRRDQRAQGRRAGAAATYASASSPA